VWPNLIENGGGARDYGGRRRCGSDLVAYGGLVEGWRAVGIDWRSRTWGRRESQHVFF